MGAEPTAVQRQPAVHAGHCRRLGAGLQQEAGGCQVSPGTG